MSKLVVKESRTKTVRPTTPKQRSAMRGTPALFGIGLAAYAFFYARGHPEFDTTNMPLPPQSVFVNPRSFAVIDSFRTSATAELFNPSRTKPPFFQIFHGDFLRILGPSPSFHQIASNNTYAFAHEAPVYNAETDELFFASNAGGRLGMSDMEHNNKVWKLNLGRTEKELEGKGFEEGVNTPVEEIIGLPESVQMTNGGTGPWRSNILLINSGRGKHAPTIAAVYPKPPYNTTILLNNYFGRQFNSLNDIKVHPSGKIYFTDVTYGFLYHFRPTPALPNQVYRFDPDSGAVSVVADGFVRCNGIAFSRDGRTAYITDTGLSGGAVLGRNQTEPATIYAYNVDPQSGILDNRRVFAYVDTGLPDGIQVDTQGNVYSGCGDGVHVWNKHGTLLGKFFIGSTSANIAFAGDGRLVILAETVVYLAHIAAKGIDLGGK